MDLGRIGQLRLQSSLLFIQEEIENKENQIGVFCVLTKVYDAIHHDTLLSKLQEYGVRGMTNLWFKSYLVYRKQVAEITCNGKKLCISTKRN
jgi:hypothetical protein